MQELILDCAICMLCLSMSDIRDVSAVRSLRRLVALSAEGRKVIEVIIKPIVNKQCIKR